MAHTVDEGVTIACSEDRFAASREYCRHDWVAHDRRITMSFCGKTLMDGDACKRHAKLDLFGPFVFVFCTHFFFASFLLVSAKATMICLHSNKTMIRTWTGISMRFVCRGLLHIRTIPESKTNIDFAMRTESRMPRMVQ